MSSSSPRDQPPARRPGVVASLVTLPFRIFGMLCGALLLSILIECLGVHFFWQDARWHHAEGMLHYELNQLSSYFRESVLVEHPGEAAKRLVDQVYDKVLVKTGVLRWAQETASQAQAKSQGMKGLKDLLNRAYVHVESYALVAGYTCLTFLVRLMVLCLTFPLFLMAVFVGFVDGVARRDIRRFSAGRESSFVYHRAKASIAPLSLLPWATYLALPVSVHPLAILMPSAILMGVAVSITSGSFKKYL